MVIREMSLSEIQHSSLEEVSVSLTTDPELQLKTLSFRRLLAIFPL
jgi:hypothetical protein